MALFLAPLMVAILGWVKRTGIDVLYIACQIVNTIQHKIFIAEIFTRKPVIAEWLWLALRIDIIPGNITICDHNHSSSGAIRFKRHLQWVGECLHHFCRNTVGKHRRKGSLQDYGNNKFFLIVQRFIWPGLQFFEVNQPRIKDNSGKSYLGWWLNQKAGSSRQ